MILLRRAKAHRHKNKKLNLGARWAGSYDIMLKRQNPCGELDIE